MIVNMRAIVILIIISITMMMKMMMIVYLTSIKALPGIKSYAEHFIAPLNYNSKPMKKILVSFHFTDKEIEA